MPDEIDDLHGIPQGQSLKDFLETAKTDPDIPYQMDQFLRAHLAMMVGLCEQYAVTKDNCSAAEGSYCSGS